MSFFNYKTLVAVTVMILAAINTSCFKEEPLNTECDIEKAWVHVNDLEASFYNANDTLINVISNEDKIVFTMRDDADVTAFAPQFTITPGATITPASGSVHDFSNGPVTYTVTSQDGKWSRKYLVSCNRMARYTTSVIDFDFEHYELDKDYHKFYVWHNTLPDGSLGDDWATGNYGFYIANSNSAPNEFPTFVLENGYEGQGVQFVTRDTGPMGRRLGKPIAAGNLFLGKFNIISALLQPLKATEFGIPFTQKPVKLSGYYQYSPSSPFTDKDFNVHPERTDAGDIYSVLYINHDRNGNPLVLYGDNVLSSENIVAVARVKNVNETNGQWVKFDIEYEYKKEIDPEMLANRGYNLTIVFSSSIDGATFEGAIGSTLKIDSVKLTCETKE
jgi:hypothetical protein